MNPAKMRRQRGRVRLTVRPSDVDLHPLSRLQWMTEVVPVDEWTAYAKCAHCQRQQPCPTEVYLHQQDGHSWGLCGGPPPRCMIEQRALQARQRETV